jgi:hypothetical protein
MCAPNHKLIFDHNCNFLAILCLEECIFILKCDELYSEDHTKSILNILEFYIRYLSRPPFQQKCKSDTLNDYLFLYQHQFLGRGILYLQKLSETKKQIS